MSEATDQNIIDDLRDQDDQMFLKKQQPALEELESIRLQKLSSYIFRKKTSIPVAVFLTPAFSYLDYWLLMLQRGDDSFAGVTFLFLGALYWWITKPKREYCKAYKIKILPEIARLFGNLKYDHCGGLDIPMLTASRIIPSHDKVKSEDCFSGTYKGIRIEFCEMEMTETRGSGKNRRTVTTFKGLGILMDMKSKRFYGQTIIDQDHGKVAEWYKQKVTNLKRANLVDPKFEKLFDVYTNDQVEARYLVDPSIMERLMNLHDVFTKKQKDPSDQKEMSEVFMKYLAKLNARFSQKWLKASFWNSKVLILIANNYNHFEPADIHIPAADSESLLSMKREIEQVLSIADQLEAYDPNAPQHVQERTA